MQDWQPGYLSLKICSLVQGAPCTLQLTVNIGKCNCEGLHISECKLQHVLCCVASTFMQQVFDYSMSCANTSVIPPCTNKVIHKYVYKFQDLSSYWIGSYLKFNRTKSILSKTKNYKLESKGGLYLTMESKKCIQWRLALWSWLPGGISCEHILQDVQILCFRFSRQPAKFNLSQRFLFVHIGPKCMDWAVQHDSPN